MKSERLHTKIYSTVWIMLAAVGYAIGMMKKFGVLDDTVSWLFSDAVFVHWAALLSAFVLTPLLFVIYRHAQKAGMNKYCKVLRIARAFFVVHSILSLILLSVMDLMNAF